MNKITSIAVGLISFLLGCKSTPYEQKNGVWYYDDHAITTKEPGFKALNKRFAKSDTAVYYRDGRIFNADAASFVAIDQHYAKDKIRAYYCDTYRKGQEYYMIKHNKMLELDNVDTEAFQVLENGYATDRKKVFYDGIQFEVKDASGFEVIDYNFARDRQVAYYNQNIIDGSDGKSFRALDDHYAADTNNIYYCDMLAREDNEMPKQFTWIVKDAKNSRFRVLEFGYATDERLVFYKGQIVQGADPMTFSTLPITTDSTDAKDTNGLFYQGKRFK